MARPTRDPFDVGEEPMVAPPPDPVIGPEGYISLISLRGFDWDQFEAGMAKSLGMDSVGEAYLTGS